MHRIDVKRALVAACIAALTSVTRAEAQFIIPPGMTTKSSPSATGAVRGTVFDSLLKKPLAHTSVILLTTSDSATTDDKGRFEFAHVPVGKHYIALTSAEFDSLGMGTVGTAVDVYENMTATATVATPSLRTLWSYRCGSQNAVGPDSGVVWGTIRDARTNAELPGAIAAFSWYDLRKSKLPGLLINETQRSALAGSDGVYFACGVPTDIAIETEAHSTTAASGRVDYAIGARRLQRVDFLVSSDMVVDDSVVLRTHSDSTNANRSAGTSTLRGIIFDAKKHPLPNAIVSIASVDTTVRTDDSGMFQLDGLPAGTHVLNVRSVGAAPASQIVALHPGALTDVRVGMADVNTLTAVKVRAEKVKGTDRRDYEDRRKIGWGTALEGKQLERGADLFSALGQISALTISQTGADKVARMKAIGMSSTSCKPVTFLDGVRTDFQFAASMQLNRYLAVEVYTFHSTIPYAYVTPDNPGCGVILIWSRAANW